MTPPDDHQSVQIESFRPEGQAGLRGRVCLRPMTGQRFPTDLLLEGNKSLVEDYPVGTRFKVQASLMNRPTGETYLFTSWQWDTQVLWRPDQDV